MATNHRTERGAQRGPRFALAASGAIAIALLAACAQPAKLEVADRTASALRGAELFEDHCALCHGARGEADGEASYLLFPPARDFSRGRFKLTSTQNGAPSDEDLIASLRRGMPGSSMPAWDWMSDADLRGLAQHVRGLAVDGLTRRWRAAGSTAEEDAELRALALAQLTPGEPVDVGRPAPETKAARALGASVYRDNCAACHGAEGRGMPEPSRDDDGSLNWARDLTAGVLKGGASHAELSQRLQSGMHGTAMPAASLSPVELAAVVAHVRSLIPRGSEDELVQHRRTIRALSVAEPLDLEDGSAPWQAAEEVDLALAPLWWRDGAILGAQVAALTDGETLALRIRWADATADAPLSPEPPHQTPPYADAVAVQITAEPEPPLFGMGDAPGINIWHWRARDVFDTEELQDVLGGIAHGRDAWRGGGVLDVPLYQEARGTVWVSGEAVAVEPEGMRNIESQHATGSSITAYPRWQAGEWQVVLTRPLESRNDGEVALEPGRPLSVSFALWNGAIGDLRGQKSVTIWHELVIDPGTH